MTTEDRGVSAHERPVMQVSEGPWKFCAPGDLNQEINCYAEDGGSIWQPVSNADGDVIALVVDAGFDWGPHRSTFDIDGRAIAALPALIESMEQLIACHEEPTCPAVAAAKELLARIRTA